jgi:hypothetical protein
MGRAVAGLPRDNVAFNAEAKRPAARLFGRLSACVVKRLDPRQNTRNRTATEYYAITDILGGVAFARVFILGERLTAMRKVLLPIIKNESPRLGCHDTVISP